MKKRFPRSFDALGEIYEFTESVLAAASVEDAVRFPVHLAMEELYTNMVKYCPGNDNEILLDVEARDGALTAASLAGWACTSYSRWWTTLNTSTATGRVL